MKKILMILTILLVGVFVNDAKAATYEDGQSHDIDYLLNEGVIIYNHSHNTDEPTTVNLLSRGTVDGVDVYDSSFFNLFDGGTVNSNLNAHNDSGVNIFGGNVNHLNADGNSTVDVTGGSMKSLHVTEDSAVNISNAYIEYGGNLKLWQNASLSMTNTTFGRTAIDWNGVINVYDNSHLTVGSGTVFDYVDSYNTSAVAVSGGFVDSMDTWDSSKANVSSGSTVYSLHAWGTSEVTMTGGHANYLTAEERSKVDVTGGSISLLRVNDDSIVNVSDANVSSIWAYLRQNSSLNLTNTTFGHLPHGPNMNTYDNSHLTLCTGTSFGFMRSYNTSMVTISGGSALNVLMKDSSQLEISDGTVDWVSAYNNSRVSISGGTVTNFVSAIDYGRIVMTGGQAHYFDLFDNSTADITGGSIWDLVAMLNGMAHISGGMLNTVTVFDTGRISIEGRGFNYNYGYIQDLSGVLTGVLLNGDVINVNFYRDTNASILLIPVPEACIADVNQLLEAQGPFGAKVTLDGSCSSDADSTPGTNDDINDFDWYEIDPCDPNNEIYLGSGQIIDCNLPLGTHTILLEVTDKAGKSDSNEITITVQDTTAPAFELSVSPMVLWPANHKMIKIIPTFDVNDICDPSPQVRLVDITMNEPGTPSDIRISDDGSIYLCATRCGNNKTGRIYTLTCEACDSSANCTTKTATVVVPHDMRK